MASFRRPVQNTFRYDFTQSVMYTYSNESISWRNNMAATQADYDKLDASAKKGFAQYLETESAWKSLGTEAEIETLKNNRSPTLPSVAGTASLVLSPHTIPGFTNYETQAGAAGVNPPDTSSPAKQAMANVEGIVALQNVSAYRVVEIKVSFVPLGTEVEYNALAGETNGGLMLDRVRRTVASRQKPKKKDEKDDRRPKFGLRADQRGTGANDRNPTITTGASVVYGSLVDGLVGDSVVADGPFITLTYLPATYRGVFPEIISYVGNPNVVWDMSYKDFMGGEIGYRRSNIDPLAFTLPNPTPVVVSKSINGTDEVKGAYSNGWVNVIDETVSYGALAIAVPSEFRNVVATYESAKDADGTEYYRPGIRNVGYCLLTWTFEFRLK